MDTPGGSVSIDMSGVEEQLKNLVEAFSADEKGIIKDIAIRIFSNTNFDMGKGAYQVAQESINYALILVDVLKKQGILK